MIFWVFKHVKKKKNGYTLLRNINIVIYFRVKILWTVQSLRNNLYNVNALVLSTRLSQRVYLHFSFFSFSARSFCSLIQLLDTQKYCIIRNLVFVRIIRKTAIVREHSKRRGGATGVGCGFFFFLFIIYMKNHMSDTREKYCRWNHVEVLWNLHKVSNYTPQRFDEM